MSSSRWNRAQKEGDALSAEYSACLECITHTHDSVEVADRYCRLCMTAAGDVDAGSASSSLRVWEDPRRMCCQIQSEQQWTSRTEFVILIAIARNASPLGWTGGSVACHRRNHDRAVVSESNCSLNLYYNRYPVRCGVQKNRIAVAGGKRGMNPLVREQSVLTGCAGSILQVVLLIPVADFVWV